MQRESHADRQVILKLQKHLTCLTKKWRIFDITHMTNTNAMHPR